MKDDLRSLLTWADAPAKADVIPPPSLASYDGKPATLPTFEPRIARAAIGKPLPMRTEFRSTAAPPPSEPTFVRLPAATPSPGIARFPIAPMKPARFANRLAFSSWAIGRGSGQSALASGGQLGGSQAGFRATYAISPTFALAGRLSAPLREHGAEAALALDWRPIRALPVTLTAERRIRVDRGGRNAFAIGLFGGVDHIPLPAGAKLDGYAQAGVVGIKRRDAYLDGALRIDRSIAEIGPARLAIGAGLWGAAQPGASRLDIGPQLVARIPAGPTTLRLGLDWRGRVAGNARPGSGPALSIGADF